MKPRPTPDDDDWIRVNRRVLAYIGVSVEVGLGYPSMSPAPRPDPIRIVTKSVPVHHVGSDKIHEFTPRSNPRLSEDVREVGAYRPRRDVERGPDLLVGFSL